MKEEQKIVPHAPKRLPEELAGSVPRRRERSALATVLGAPEVRCPVTDRAVQLIRGARR